MKYSLIPDKLLSSVKYSAASLLAGTSAFSGASAVASDTKPPNIVFIVADDLGWNGINCHDTGCDGYDDDCDCNDDASRSDSHFYRTPNLKEFRESAMRFTRAYSNPSSHATRLGLMTGKHPFRCSYNYTLPLAETLIPEAIDEAVTDHDYVSAVLGKWQIINSAAKPHPRYFEPFRQGFDYQFAGSWTPMGRVASSMNPTYEAYWEPDPAKCINWYGSENGGWYQEDPPKNVLIAPGKYGITGLYSPGLGDPNGMWAYNNPTDDHREFLTDSLAQRAVEFMNTTTDPNHPNNGKPFFLYVPFNPPHAPFPTNIVKADGSDYAGYEDDDDRHDNSNTFGDCDPNDYAKLIEKLDDNIGRILDALAIVDPNAIVIFYSDNGGHTGYENPGTDATSNEPLKDGKGAHYEGGIRVPLMVKWPGVTDDPDDEDSVCKEPVHVCDFLPTIVNMAAGDDYKPDTLSLLDGQSFVPLLEQHNGSTFERNNNCFYVLSYGGWSKWYLDETDPGYSPTRDVIFGTGLIVKADFSGQIDCKDYKLIRLNSSTPTYELYDLDTDISEEVNLLSGTPTQNDQEIADALQIQLGNWFDRQKVRRIRSGVADEYFDTIDDAVDGDGTGNRGIVVNGDVLELPPRTFFEKVSFTDSSLNNKTFTIQSQHPDDPRYVAATMINPSPTTTGPVVTFNGLSTSNVTLDGITISGGYFASGHGAGINGNNNTSSTITRCIISHNSIFGTGNGGGISKFNGTIENCTIYNNMTKLSGGALAGCDGTIRNCLIYANTASKGGAMYNCSADIYNCTIAGNIANDSSANGGGLYDCTGDIVNSILAFNNNHAIYQSSASSYPGSVKNCLFYGNPDGDLYTYVNETGVTTTGISGNPNINDYFNEASGNIDNDPCFENCFTFVDHIKADEGWSTAWLTGDSNDFTTIPVDDANDPNTDYTIGDFIEFNNDGVMRKVTDVNTVDDTITFRPAYLMEEEGVDDEDTDGTADEMRNFTIPSNYVILYNWGPNTKSVIEDFHLQSISPCINTGDDTLDVTGQTDIDGDVREYADRVDIGADEAAPLAKRDVSGTLSWYYSIQDAIDAASDSETITVYPGIYKESLDFTDRSVTVQGSAPNDWDIIEATIIDPNAVLP